MHVLAVIHAMQVGCNARHCHEAKDLSSPDELTVISMEKRAEGASAQSLASMPLDDIAGQNIKWIKCIKALHLWKAVVDVPCNLQPIVDINQ